MKHFKSLRILLLVVVSSTCSMVAGQDAILDMGPYEKLHNSLLEVSAIEYDFVFRQDTLSVDATWGVSWPSLEQPPDQLLFTADRSWVIQDVFINEVQISSFAVEGNQLNIPISDKRLDRVEVKIRYQGPVAVDKMISIDEDQLYHLARYVQHDNGQGYDLRGSESGHYWEQVQVRADVHTDENTYGITSLGSSQSKIGRFTLVLADKASYQMTSAIIQGTEFQIYNLKATDLFSPETVVDISHRVWPQYLSKWPLTIEKIVFIENSDSFFGGQIIGTNVFQFNIGREIPVEVQGIIPDYLGIEPCGSTKEIAEKIFHDSENPWEDYLLNLIIHELGHLFFGFGKTAERKPFLHDYWFSLGLGFIHDQELYRSLTTTRPGLIDFATHFYQTRMDTIPSIDKRLTAPDVSNDAPVGVTNFHRVQYFAHARSYLVLQQLRATVGDENFMNALEKYVESGTLDGGYEAFRKYLVPNYISEAELVLFEKEHQIF